MWLKCRRKSIQQKQTHFLVCVVSLWGRWCSLTCLCLLPKHQNKTVCHRRQHMRDVSDRAAGGHKLVRPLSKPVQRRSPHQHSNGSVCMPNTVPGGALMWRSRLAERAPTKVMKIARLMSALILFHLVTSEPPQTLFVQSFFFHSFIYLFFRRLSVDA